MPRTTQPLFGSHLSIAGGHANAVRAAADLGFATVQVFTKSSNQWKAKPLTQQSLDEYREALAATGLKNPVGHTSYLINLASPDDTLWQKSIDAMTTEVDRAEALSLTDLVVHPGAHMGAGEDAGLARVVQAIDEVLRRTAGQRVVIDLESTAGQGTCLGCKIDHLAWAIHRIKQAERVGICHDTCHLLAAGYRLDTPQAYNQFIDEWEHKVGCGRVRVWHLNDSARECGSRVDRHAGIGRGHVGIGAFRAIVNDPRFAGKPMILETPKGLENGQELDAINLNILRGLVDKRSSRSKKSGAKSATSNRAGRRTR